MTTNEPLDPDLEQLNAAHALYVEQQITETEYIERVVAIFMRDSARWMTSEEREDVAHGLRFVCHTSPEMRTRLGLEPFE